MGSYRNPPHHPYARKVVVVADAMFMREQFGVLVLRDPHEKENLYWREIQIETVSSYRDAIASLQERGFTIEALVVDGKRGVKEAFSDIPIQMCHFHQVKTVTRYITKNPKLPASIELRRIVLTLKDSNEEAFTEKLQQWYEKWGDFLKERTVDTVTGKTQFTHRRLRSAYFSLKKNLPYLFTFEKHPDLHIPKTTNSLEGLFSHIKTSFRVHRGLSREKKRILIGVLLRGK